MTKRKQQRSFRGLVLVAIFVCALGSLSAITSLVATSKPNLNLPEVSPASLQADVMALTSTSLPRNYKNKAALLEAGNYIKDQWEALGLTVEKQSFPVYGDTFSNYVTRFGPADAPTLVVGAHYDVCGEQPGADDNASGVAGLLALARMLTAEQPALNYQIELVAYTLEEPPFFRSESMGSAVHARSLEASDRSVRGMICLEMIGYFTDEPRSQSYPIGALKLFYPTKGNFIAVVGKLGQGRFTKRIKKGMKKGSTINVRSINAPASIPGIDFSDHLNYWAAGYQAVMVTNTAFYRNHEYHEPGDTPDRLDYNRMAEVVKGVYNAIITLP